MNLFDTNVLLDIATADPIWLPWSENQFRTAAAQGPILINPISRGIRRRTDRTSVTWVSTKMKRDSGRKRCGWTFPEG